MNNFEVLRRNQGCRKKFSSDNKFPFVYNRIINAQFIHNWIMIGYMDPKSDNKLFTDT